MSKFSGELRLNDDIVFIPVVDLDEGIRAQLECADDDVALSRPGARAGSKIIDAESAKLLSLFREPRTAIEAVILFARSNSLEAEAVLESAYPMLRRMIEGGVLVRAVQNGESAIGIAFRRGEAALGKTVTRTLQVLEDTEVYLLASATGEPSVLKIERPVRDSAFSARELLEREANVLPQIEEDIAPRLLDRGSLGGRTYIEIEFLNGVDAQTAAAEWRERKDTTGQLGLLSLAASIARCYARLHSQGVLHGDVHPRNVIIHPSGSARLIDFGLARMTTDGSLPSGPKRGGIPFFFDPEVARAYLDGQSPPPVTEESEQYSLAALIYLLVTGSHWQDFRLERQGMLEDIVGQPVLRFSQRGIGPWPSLEEVLRRALSKDPCDRFPSVAEFADAISAATPEDAHNGSTPIQSAPQLQQLLTRTKELAAIDGEWLTGELHAPYASLNYGSTGVALALLCIAQRQSDPLGLATADVWACRAARDGEREGAFYNSEIGITHESVGSGSPFHTESGVYAVAALIARASAAVVEMFDATDKFLAAARRPLHGLDLTLGKSSTLLASAILLDATAGMPGDWTALKEFGDGEYNELWKELERKPSIVNADIDHIGIAHGWAGYAYATLQWSRIIRSPVPDGLPRRLEELAALAMPAGRGVEWPWMLRMTGDPAVMPGWCNGSAGHVFLWTLAHRVLGDERWLEMAERAAWNSWESNDTTANLCCGLVGRAYALLNFFRHTGEQIWLDRARMLGNRAATNRASGEYSHSLFKGELGLAVLAADLEVPQQAVMPFFEPFGYSGPAS